MVRHVWLEVVPYFFIALHLACLIAFLVKFKATAPGLLGGAAFGLHFLASIAQHIIFRLRTPNALAYYQFTSAAHLLGGVLLLAAILSVPVARLAPFDHTGYQASQQATLSCPHCARSNPAGAFRCRHCGANLPPPPYQY